MAVLAGWGLIISDQFIVDYLPGPVLALDGPVNNVQHICVLFCLLMTFR